MTPESENCQTSELTKDQQDDIYKAIIMLNEIETDLFNINLTMENGKWFRAKDHLNEARPKVTIAINSIQQFIKHLKSSEVWINKN